MCLLNAYKFLFTVSYHHLRASYMLISIFILTSPTRMFSPPDRDVCLFGSLMYSQGLACSRCSIKYFVE